VIQAPLIRVSNQARALLAGYAVFAALYLGSAAFHLRAPVALAPSPLEPAIPFLAWTIWLYLSQFLLLPAAILLAKDDAARSQAFYSMVVATVAAAAVFLLWPTQLPRQELNGHGILAAAWSVLYFSDTPNNCIPSLHVALAAIAGAALWRARWRATALVWPAAIMVSTLTTKQHIVWDVVAGLVLAPAAWSLTPNLIRHERPHPTTDPARA
jgi:hypothetical protein